MRDEQPITEAQKKAITASGLSIKAIHHETGVSRQSMMHFVRGTRTLRLDIADKLAKYFGLELRPATRKTATKTAPKTKGN